MISPCMFPAFSLVKSSTHWLESCNNYMSYFYNFSRDLTAAQAIAIYELVEQCPSVVTEPVCLPDPTTMQQLIGESAVTSSRGKGKI